ncbi:hypothetical protein ACNKHO_21620 [Shigella flexneri]
MSEALETWPVDSWVKFCRAICRLSSG